MSKNPECIFIEKATPADADAILGFAQLQAKQAKEKPLAAAPLKKKILSVLKNKTCFCLMVKTEKKTVGYFVAAITTSTHSKKKVGEMIDGYLLPAYRDIEIAPAAVEIIFDWFKSQKLAHGVIASELVDQLSLNDWQLQGFEPYAPKILFEL